MELAAKTGLDPGTLTRTLDQYNAAARSGRDEECTAAALTGQTLCADGGLIMR